MYLEPRGTLYERLRQRRKSDRETRGRSPSGLLSRRHIVDAKARRVIVPHGRAGRRNPSTVSHGNAPSEYLHTRAADDGQRDRAGLRARWFARPTSTAERCATVCETQATSSRATPPEAALRPRNWPRRPDSMAPAGSFANATRLQLRRGRRSNTASNAREMASRRTHTARPEEVLSSSRVHAPRRSRKRLRPRQTRTQQCEGRAVFGEVPGDSARP